MTRAARWVAVAVGGMGVSAAAFICSHFPPPQEKLILAATRHEASLLVWIAAKEGFFYQEGLDVQIKPVESGIDALAALFSKKVDIGIGAHATLAAKSFERHDFKILATIHTANNSVKVVARKDRGIRQISDLRRKKVATHFLHSGFYFLNALLLHVKVPFAIQDIEIVFMDEADFLPALLKGKVDAIVEREPEVYRTAKILGDRAVVYGANDLYVTTHNLVCSPSFASRRSETVTKFLRALLHAEKHILGSERESLLLLRNELGLDADYVDRHWRDSRWSVRLDENLILSLEEDARSLVQSGYRRAQAIPDMTEFMHGETLARIARSTVGILQHPLESAP